MTLDEEEARAVIADIAVLTRQFPELQRIVDDSRLQGRLAESAGDPALGEVHRREVKQTELLQDLLTALQQRLVVLPKMAQVTLLELQKHRGKPKRNEEPASLFDSLPKDGPSVKPLELSDVVWETEPGFAPEGEGRFERFSLDDLQPDGWQELEVLLAGIAKLLKPEGRDGQRG